MLLYNVLCVHTKMYTITWNDLTDFNIISLKCSTKYPYTSLKNKTLCNSYSRDLAHHRAVKYGSHPDWSFYTLKLTLDLC